MANILKVGQIFNPSISANYGIDMSNSSYYGVIDSIEYNKNEKMCSFSLDIYGSKELRQSKTAKHIPSVVDRIVFNFVGDSFDEKIGKDGITVERAYALSLEDERLSNWQSDEQ